MATDLTYHSAEVNGIVMRYDEAGSGPSVVLLHGLPETWYAPQHQILMLDQHYERGHNATTARGVRTGTTAH